MRPAQTTLKLGERLEAGVVLATIVLGCQVLWIGVPLGGMWLASKLTDSFGLHQPLALALILPSMIVMTLGLVWLNDVYLRIKKTPPAPGRASWRPARRGPLEPALATTFVIALVALFVWFFAFAENPARGIFG